MERNDKDIKTERKKEDNYSSTLISVITVSTIFILIGVLIVPSIFSAGGLGAIFRHKYYKLGMIVLFGLVGFNMTFVLLKSNNKDVEFGFLSKIFLMWAIGFFLMNLLIEYVVPGWKSPFSNTLGYAFSYLFYDVKDTIDSLMNTSNTNHEKIIEKIYSDNSQFINLFTPDNMIEQIKSMINNNVFKQPDNMSLDAYISSNSFTSLKNIIYLKDDTSFSLWMILTYITSILYTSSQVISKI